MGTNNLTPDEEEQIIESLENIKKGKFRVIPIDDYIKELEDGDV